jgi:hypothetical protein
MPHVGQNLPLAAKRGVVALVFALIAVGCARSGDVVVVIDSTMRAEAVEVVAVPVTSASLVPASIRQPVAGGDSGARLIAIRDTASALDVRFRALRDTLTRDVNALDGADRTTPAYAQRYAEIRRRTQVAESIRARRDSVRRREELLRARLGTRAPALEPAGAVAPSAGAADDGRATVRARAVNGTATLSLDPGEWSIGIAAPGADATVHSPVTVRRGSTQTVHIRPPASRQP